MTINWEEIPLVWVMVPLLIAYCCIPIMMFFEMLNDFKWWK